MSTQRKQDLIDLYNKLSKEYSSKFTQSILPCTGRSGQQAARDFIAANAILAELNKTAITSEEKMSLVVKQDAKRFLHPTTLFRLNMYTPCLAYRYDEMKPHEQANLFNNPNIVFSEKENGNRGVLVHHKGVTKLYSRNYSVDGSLPEYWDNVLQSCDSAETFALDVEIKYEPKVKLTEILEEYGVHTDSQLEAMSSLLQMNTKDALAIQTEYKERFGEDLVVFRLIAPLFYKGRDYRKLTLGEGMKIRKEFVEFCNNAGMNVKPIRVVSGTKEEKEIFLNQIIDVEHGEGVVTWNLNAVYCTEDRRDKNVFVKIKRSVGGQAAKAGLGDTIDAWVSGYKLGTPETANENLVAALEFTISVVGKDNSVSEHVVAYAPNLELELKKAITEIGEDGKPRLKQEIYGLVGSLSGQNISYRSKRLTHPRLLQFPRHDKQQYDCIYTQTWIDSQTDYQEHTEKDDNDFNF